MASMLPWPQCTWTSEREQTWCRLEQWLKLNYAADVLMPAPRGEKRPAYTHAAGSWTWARYDWVCRKRKTLDEKDVGLLLRDLCVVDVDTFADADALEARFPELRAAPAEATARGRHYFFSRSPLADEHGYYDGAAQRTPTVDYKTRAWGGGSGFVVVAPSQDKNWLRAPWEACPNGELAAISDALLDAVAAPRHAPLRVALRFLASAPDSPPVAHESTLLPTCAYVAGALEVAGGADESLSAALSAITLHAKDADADLSAALGAVSLADAPLPLPEVVIPSQFPADLFLDLERVAAGLDPDIGDDPAAPPAWLADAAAYEARIEALIALADFLGAPAGAMAVIRAAGSRGGRNRGFWLDVSRPWALACMAAARESEAGRLVAVDAALAASLKHEPLLADAPHDHRWVLHGGPRARADVAPGASVLAADPSAAAEASLPAFVLQALRSEAGHLALAGGGALAAVAAPGLLASPALDYDLFVYGFTGSADDVSAAADALVRRVAAIPGAMHGPRGAMVSRSAVTLRCEWTEADYDDDKVPPITNNEEPEFVVQIVLRVAKSPADILGGFDLAPSKVCVLYDGADAQQLSVLAAPDWPLALRHGAYALDGRAWSRATALRVFKYCAKGFDALVPALRDRSRLRFRLTKNAKSWWNAKEKLEHLDGFELLYALERSIQRSINEDTGSWTWNGGFKKRTSKRIMAKDVERAARKLLLQQRTDYATALKTMRTFGYALQSAIKRTLQQIGVVAIPDRLQEPLGWRQPWSRAQFHPIVAELTDALSLVDTPAT